MRTHIPPHPWWKLHTCQYVHRMLGVVNVCVFQLLATLLIQYERMKGVQSSGVMLVYWLLALVCATVTFRSKILQALDQVSVSQLYHSWTFLTPLSAQPANVSQKQYLTFCVFQPSTVCVWRYTTFYIYYALLLVALFLSCLSDQLPLFSPAVKDPVSLFTCLFFNKHVTVSLIYISVYKCNS